MKRRKSQFKIQQMAFMLLAVVLFFVMVGLFWIVLQSRNLQKTAVQLKQEQAILLSEYISGASEFTCGDYCIDTDRVIILENRTIYKEFWPVKYIKIRKLDGKEDKVCNKANYPDCNVYNVYENKEVEYEGEGEGSFVALCRYEQVEEYATKICDLGKIIIGYEVAVK